MSTVHMAAFGFVNLEELDKSTFQLIRHKIRAELRHHRLKLTHAGGNSWTLRRNVGSPKNQSASRTKVVVSGTLEECCRAALMTTEPGLLRR